MLKKRGWILLSLVLLVGVIYGSFVTNLGGLQDWWYGSKYFRPYVTLKQEQSYDQVVLLKDGRVFLPGAWQSELFDPVTMTSEMVSGSYSLDVWTQEPNFTVLRDGNVLVTQGRKLGAIRCRGPEIGSGKNSRYCPEGKTPLFDVQLKQFRWIDFPLTHLQGHTTTVLSNGDIIFIGGFLKIGDKPGYILLDGKSYFENNILRYSPKENKLQVIGKLQVPRNEHQAFLANSDEIIVYGGYKLSGNHIFDMTEEENNLAKWIERVNLRTGQSEIIGETKFVTGYWEDVVPVGKNRYLIDSEEWRYGNVYSEILDLTRPKETEVIVSPIPNTKWGFYMGGTGSCQLVAPEKVICVGNALVREIDVQKKTSKIIDELTVKPITSIQAFQVPKVGLLVFGKSRSFLKDNNVVQKFNLERYLQDTEEGK